LYILGRNGDNPHFEFLGLLQIIARPSHCVFTYAQQIIEGNHSEISNGAVKFVCLLVTSELYREFWYLRLYWKLLDRWGISLAESIQHLLNAWKELVRPNYFGRVGVCSQSNCLSNGCDCARYAPSLDLFSSTVVSCPDSCCKPRQEVDSDRKRAVLLSRTKKSSNKNLLYQVISTRSGSTLVVRIPINFYKYFCKSHMLVNCISNV
jgi:hypothetical protein